MEARFTVGTVTSNKTTGADEVAETRKLSHVRLAACHTGTQAKGCPTTIGKEGNRELAQA